MQEIMLKVSHGRKSLMRVRAPSSYGFVYAAISGLAGTVGGGMRWDKPETCCAKAKLVRTVLSGPYHSLLISSWKSSWLDGACCVSPGSVVWQVCAGAYKRLCARFVCGLNVLLRLGCSGSQCGITCRSKNAFHVGQRSRHDQQTEKRCGENRNTEAVWRKLKYTKFKKVNFSKTEWDRAENRNVQATSR